VRRYEADRRASRRNVMQHLPTIPRFEWHQIVNDGPVDLPCTSSRTIHLANRVTIPIAGNGWFARPSRGSFVPSRWATTTAKSESRRVGLSLRLWLACVENRRSSPDSVRDRSCNRAELSYRAGSAGLALAATRAGRGAAWEERSCVLRPWRASCGGERGSPRRRARGIVCDIRLLRVCVKKL